MANIAIADVLNHTPLPIDSQDIITKVKLVIAGTIAGNAPDTLGVRLISTSEQYSYYPTPVIFEYEDALHATYGAERSFPLSEGINPFLDATDAGVPEPTTSGAMVNAGTPSAARDGDPSTYATLSSLGSAGTLTYAFNAEVVGFRLRANFTVASSANSLLVIHDASRTGGYQVYSRHRFVARGEALEAYAVLPHDARNETVNTSDLTTRGQTLTLSAGASAFTTLEVYEFYPLILNETLLEDIAKANIRLPASAPQRVTVRGYVAPEPEHTIVGWPGGDFTGTVAQQQYEVDRTVIDFEQAGSPVGLPAEAIEAARAQRVATQSVVDTAGYGLKMGERQ